MIDLFDYAIAIGLLIIVLLTVRLAVGLAWAGWRGWHGWQVEHAARRIELRRLAADVDILTVRPGEIMLHREELSSVVLHQIHLELARIEAMRTHAPVPHTYHYSVTNKEGPQPMYAQIEEQPAAVIPSFAELLRGDSLGHGRFLLGCDLATGRAITGDWKELYSTALGGLSGTGKSTTARFLLAQAALNGCKFVVLDPHAGAGEDSLAATLSPLVGAMLCAAASSDKQILDAARYVDSIGRRRIEGDGDRSPVILCIDEATSLLSRSTVGGPLGLLLETIAQEYRKVGIFALCSAQIWLAGRSGGSSALRDSFASAYVHRMKRNQARLLLPTDEASQVEKLDAGQAVLWRTSGETQTIVIPNTTAADVVSVAQRIGVGEVAHNRLSTLESSAFNGAIPKADLKADQMRVIELFEAGQTLRQIATEVYGVSGGGNYNKVLDEIQTVIRDHLYRLKGGQHDS